MTWSYDDDEATSRDIVRGKIGDVDTSFQLLTDETIDSVLSRYPNVIAAAIECVKKILGKLARDIDTSGAGISTTRSQKFSHYRDLLAELKDELSTQGGVFVGGASIADNEAQADDTDANPPAFKIGEMDHP